MHRFITSCKILTCLIVILTSSVMTMWAQEQKDALQKLTEVLQSVENVATVRNMVAIRKSMEQDVNEVKILYEQKKASEQNVEALSRQYGEVQTNYNYVFDELKRDLIAKQKNPDYSRIQVKYDSRVTMLQADYEAFHRSVIALEQSGNRAVIVPIIIGAVELLIDVIRTKKLERVAMLDAFNTISPYFSMKFNMRDWVELWPDYPAAAPASLGNQNPGSAFLDKLISAPYSSGKSRADIELFLGDPASGSMVRQTLITGTRVGNIQKLSSATSYHPGDKFALQISSGHFIHFFALDNATNRLQLLYPERTRNTTISKEGPSGSFVPYDSVVRLPNSGTYVIDKLGASEKWIVLVSQSELFDADAFAQKYVRISSGFRNTTISTAREFDAKQIRDESSNSSYSASELMKVYEINILKAL